MTTNRLVNPSSNLEVSCPWYSYRASRGFMSVIFLSSIQRFHVRDIPIEHPSVWHLLFRSRTQHVVVSKTRQGNIFHSPCVVEALVYPRETIKYLCLPSYQSPISPYCTRKQAHCYDQICQLYSSPQRDGCFALEGTVPWNIQHKNHMTRSNASSKEKSKSDWCIDCLIFDLFHDQKLVFI